MLIKNKRWVNDETINKYVQDKFLNESFFEKLYNDFLNDLNLIIRNNADLVNINNKYPFLRTKLTTLLKIHHKEIIDNSLAKKMRKTMKNNDLYEKIRKLKEEKNELNNKMMLLMNDCDQKRKIILGLEKETYNNHNYIKKMKRNNLNHYDELMFMQRDEYFKMYVTDNNEKILKNIQKSPENIIDMISKNLNNDNKNEIAKKNEINKNETKNINDKNNIIKKIQIPILKKHIYNIQENNNRMSKQKNNENKNENGVNINNLGNIHENNYTNNKREVENNIIDIVLRNKAIEVEINNYFNHQKKLNNNSAKFKDINIDYFYNNNYCGFNKYDHCHHNIVFIKICDDLQKLIYNDNKDIYMNRIMQPDNFISCF